MSDKHQIVIVGGGNAGISVAARLINANKHLDIAVIDPATSHYYQPAWTLVGGGVFNIKNTKRSEADVMPEGVTWIKEKVTGFIPGENAITLESGGRIEYEYLVVAAGIQINWNAIKGLTETLGKNNVCSNYSYEYAPYTFECIKNMQGGKAVFTNPSTPIKCGGAPHKIMYMAADYFRKHGILGKTKVEYWSGGTKLFAIPEYERTLLKVCERANIGLNFNVNLVEVDGPNKKAKFVGIGEQNKGKEYIVDFDMLHVTPPQSAPDFIKSSELANKAGWVDVDKYTLQHVKYPNVFSLGDAAGLPTSKTGAAVRKQAPVLVKNILSVMNHEKPAASYNGYSSCPIVTRYGKLVLAEFDYENKRRETFPFDQSKERTSMYLLKRFVLPWLYWHKILPGKA